MSARAYIVLFIYYLVVVSRAAPDYTRAMARAAGSTNPVQIARALAGPWALSFLQAAARSFGAPPARVLQLAKGERSSSPDGRPTLRPAGDDDSSDGPGLSSMIPALGGLAGTAIGGPVVGSAIGGILEGLGIGQGPDSPPDPNEVAEACHRELGGAFTAEDRRRYGVSRVGSPAVGHLRVGKCSSARGARNACVALEPNAIRLGNDYVVARYPGRLANELANKFRVNGTMTDAGKYVLASAYVNTIRAVQNVPQGFGEYINKFGYRPPQDECDRLPPHKSDARINYDIWYLDEGPDVQSVSWLVRQRLLLNQAAEFLDQLQRELHAARPLPRDVRLAVSRIGVNATGDFSLRASRDNPPRLQLVSRDATNFLPPE